MDAARQVIRWSIPGTIFLLTVLFGQLLASIAYGVHPNLGKEVAQSDASLLIVLIGATIPIGFLLYQLYHVFLEEAIAWLPPYVVPIDRGRQILRQLDPQQRERIKTRSGIAYIDDSELATDRIRPWKLRAILLTNGERQVPEHLAGATPRQVYVYLRHQNWRAVKWALFNELPEERSAVVRREYTGFADIYHSIGACRMAVVCGFCALCAYDAAVHPHSVLDWPRSVATVSVWSFIVATTFAILTYARRHTLISIQDLIADNLRFFVSQPNEGAPSTSAWSASRRRLFRSRR